MADAIGLSGIHNVSGICDLCGIKCDPNVEELNALDCTYKDCPPMVYHQDCLEKYLKSIRLEKNRKTGFKCPRGCGKGTRFEECCRGKVDKSHPIHVRHDSKGEKKELVQSPNRSSNEQKEPNLKKPEAILNVHEIDLVKLVPAKSEDLESEWRMSVTRSKSLDKTASKKGNRSKGRKSASNNITFTSHPKMKLRTSKSEGLSETRSVDVQERTKSCKGESDIDPSDSASLQPASSVHSFESSDGKNGTDLPSLQEENLRHYVDRIEIHKRCKTWLGQWKTGECTQQLESMGFAIQNAMAAVHLFGDDLEKGIHWLMENPDISQTQVMAILQHQTASEISIEQELKTMELTCRRHGVDDLELERTVIQCEGNLNKAIHRLLGSRLHEWALPEWDLSLGIVQSESPMTESSRWSCKGSLEDMGSSSMLECVLGNALNEYKSGNADFTDLANKGVDCYGRFGSPSTTFESAFPMSYQRNPSNDPFQLRHLIGDLFE